VYDGAGHLIGQYDGAGAAQQETVWLGGLPVATLQAGTAYYIAPDHLGSPHQITDGAKNVVWFWDHDPFGNGAPTGTLTYSLRFPGQFYDPLTGLNYNGFRNYDPATGRYIESDPIGLEGGVNTYSYVGANPLSHKDARGLCIEDLCIVETLILSTSIYASLPPGSANAPGVDEPLVNSPSLLPSIAGSVIGPYGGPPAAAFVRGLGGSGLQCLAADKVGEKIAETLAANITENLITPREDNNRISLPLRPYDIPLGDGFYYTDLQSAFGVEQ
jgi:RHS repeat-associated protein